MSGKAGDPASAAAGRAGHAGGLAGDDGGQLAGWELLTRSVRMQAPFLSAPPPAARGLCAACRIPVRPGNAHCYPCGLHAETLPGLLADVVVPICYAVKGGEHARNLWLYKSARPGAAVAGAALRALLVVFLRDHGPCVWRAAGMTRPSHLAVVPSGRGRAGPHPLRTLIGTCLSLPWAALDLRLRDEPWTRDLDAGRFRAAPLAGASIALLDDTWTTGASAESACAALRLAGARSVAVIVLGRHVSAPEPSASALAPGAGAPGSAAACASVNDLPAMPFRPRLCAVHAHAGENGQ
ncbi:MAG TPA: phosphoribosyltransferase [Streptosporangiaceae bacterium]|nr:phosphoribosyltransferase [Streptosporangiaceae bacterium]